MNLPKADSPRTYDMRLKLDKHDWSEGGPLMLPWRPLSDSDRKWLKSLESWFKITECYAPVSKESFGLKVLYWRFKLHHVASGEADGKTE